MKPTAKLLTLAIALMVVPITAFSQTDKFGKTDTVYADVAKLNDSVWTITVSYTNDEDVAGLSVPLKLTAGLNRIVADSAVYNGGRVENWGIKAFRSDTAIQCITLGMVADIGPAKKWLTPGSGRLVTVFVSSLEGKPIEKLAVDTTTTYPSNTLECAASMIQGVPPDTTRVLDRSKREIRPAFVVRYPK
jgi:hypothetical protein